MLGVNGPLCCKQGARVYSSTDENSNNIYVVCRIIVLQVLNNRSTFGHRVDCNIDVRLADMYYCIIITVILKKVTFTLYEYIFPLLGICV